VKLDDEVRRVSERMRELRQERTHVASSIHNYVDTNKLNNATINISDGRLRFVETQTAQTLTFKLVEECLSELIPKVETVEQIMTHIKNKRAVKSSQEIKRYFSPN
jgi:hypothetical protein